MTAFTKTTPGHTVGAKKVDADEYMPEPGDWEETNVVCDLGRGWLICDQKTNYDIRLTASLTMTCVGSYLEQRKIVPFDEAAWEEMTRARIRRTCDTPLAKKGHSGLLSYERWLDKCAEDGLKHERTMFNSMGAPCHKILHLRDPKGRPRLCILMCLEEAIASLGTPARSRWRVEYCDSNDFGQEHPFVIDDLRFRLLEARIGTGGGPPKAMEKYVIKWYRKATGMFDTKLYEEAVTKRKNYAAYMHNPSPDQIREFRAVPA